MTESHLYSLTTVYTESNMHTKYERLRHIKKEPKTVDVAVKTTEMEHQC